MTAGLDARAASRRPDVLRPAEFGIYSDDRVIVERLALGGRLDAVARADGRVHVRHDLRSAVLDDDIAEELADALRPVAADHATFTSAFTGIVLTSDDDPARAWDRFYVNSLRRIGDPAHGGYVEVYRHALGLVGDVGDVLDLGCGFGFLAMHLARQGRRVVAADADRSTVRLLARQCRRLAYAMDVVGVDGTAVPRLRDRGVGTTLLLHVLEHLDDVTGCSLVREAMRVSRRRVVVAVPYEHAPEPLYGHVRRFDPDDLAGLGARSGWRYRVEDHCGGWLVLDRPLDPSNEGGSS